MRRLLTAPDRPTGIFCWSDMDAIPLLSEAKALGIRIPEELSNVSHDNSPVTGRSMVDLGSVDQDGWRLGRLVAEALLSRVKGWTADEYLTLNPRLVVRGSLSRT